MKSIKILLLLLLAIKTIAQSTDTTNKHLIDSATMYLTGTYKPYNPTKAFAIFMQRASNGEAKAMNAVALQYAKGIGIDSNFNAAVYWFHQAINKGYTKAFVNLGMIYKHKANDSAGYAVAFNIFDSAVNSNEPSAFFAQGYMFYKGLGCTQSYTNALQLFKRGIDSNRADCMYFTGLCFNNGFGVLANADSANYYITQAASLGYKQANQVLSITDSTTTNSTAARNATPNGSSPSPIGEGRGEVKDQRPKTEAVFTNLPLTNETINLNGIYTGILTQYDYSGKQIIKQTKLTLNLNNDNGTIVGDWIQNDTVHLPLSAIQYNNSLVFYNMQLKQSSNTNQRRTRNNNQNDLIFKSANFQYHKHNDSIMLVGSLYRFNKYQNEPDKPINITLLQQSKNGSSPSPIGEGRGEGEKQQTSNSIVIYPNPINDLFNISIDTDKESNASFTIYTQEGKQVFQQKQHLQKGKQTIAINAALSKGVYIIKINMAQETISKVLIKAN